MPAVNITDLNNAQLDVNTIAGVATSTASTVTDRLGNTKNTLSGFNAALLASSASLQASVTASNTSILASAAAVQGSIGYLPPVAYAAGINLTVSVQTVSYSGQTYAPLLSALPFTTSGTFETVKFRLIQGVAGADLAAPNGSRIIRWIQSGVGAVAIWIENKFRQKVNFLDFVPEAEQAAILDGSSNFDCSPALTAAIASISGGNIEFSKGRFVFNSPVAFNKSGLGITGEGFKTNIVVNHTGDLFVISAPLAQFSNVEITIESADRANGYLGAVAIGPDTYPTYTGGSVFNCVDGGSLGNIKEMRITGKAGINNGIIVRNDSTAAPGWSYRNIVVSGGVRWASCFRITTVGTTVTNATHRFNNVGGVGLEVQDAAIYVDGLVDTLNAVNVGFDVRGGPVLWTRCSNANARTYFPRWVRFSQGFAETGTNVGFTGTAFKLDSVLDADFTGCYAQSCTHAVEIGKDVRGARFSGSIFGLVEEEAVIINAGSQGVDFDKCTFLNTAYKTANAKASILVKAGATGWKIRNNLFSRNNDILATAIPKNHISVEAGASDNYEISGNIASFVAGTASISNLATGSTFAMWQNPGFDGPNVVSGFPTTFNSGITTNSGMTLRGSLIADQGPVLIDSSVSAISLGVGTLIAWGIASPEGTLVAPPGSTYHRQSGGAGTSFYVKESGSGNTGWIAK